jgi:putative tryptophan/tyrosine transport system substrate-binding protein
MKRRVPILLALTPLLLVATSWTDASWAQTRILRVGILDNTPTRNWLSDMGFSKTLSEHGWTEGKNVTFEYRDSGGDPTRVTEPAAELVRLKVDVLFPIGPPSVRAAFAATREIPIVAHDLETDPVAAGYAQSYSRPGGNLTGLFLDSPELTSKWLELLKTMVPRLSRVVVLWDATSGPVPLNAVRNAAPKLGVKLQVIEVHAAADIDKAPSAFGRHVQAVIALPSPLMYFENEHLAKLTTKHRLPAISMFVPFADAGGLMVYGPNMASTVEQCAVLLAKVLSGAKPGDLPIERPSKFEFVLNLKTARDLHLTVPDTVSLRADRVIEK